MVVVEMKEKEKEKKETHFLGNGSKMSEECEE